MKTLYLDLFSGIAGDMFTGALLDLGVDPGRLERELKKLKLDGYHLHVSRGDKSGIAGTKFDVHLAGHGHGPGKARSPKSEVRSHKHGSGHNHAHEHEHGRNFADIKKLISASKLSPWVKRKSVAVFQRIAEAEGKIHGMPASKVHFHEVGAVDSIVDIVGGCIALELLGKPRVVASAVTEGVGWVDCEHGRLPVPAPATLAILGARGVGVTQCEEPHELVTPTGAALIAEFAESFGPMANLAAERIGFGLGTRENKTRPNVLRAVLSQSAIRSPQSAIDWQSDTVAILETNLDDCTGEVLGHFLDTAMDAGALDVFYVPVVMKKNRPGVLLTLLCVESEADRFSELILRETTAFGVRRRLAERRKLKREIRKVKTEFGAVDVKVGLLGGQVVQAAPEYESCRKLALKANAPVKLVFAAATQAMKARK
jgi:uncharacterized protein (TIGR00299 family) protein